MNMENSHSDTDPTSGKILPVAILAERLAAHKAQRQRIVQCHGVFDLVHPGHVRHLKAAKAEGDVLVVTITADCFVDKGPGRPAFNENLRAEFLAAIACVDYVAINSAPDAVGLIHTLSPDVYVKGSDYVRPEDDPTGKIREEENAVQQCGGRMHFTDEVTFSSSHLINRRLNIFPEETERWLQDFRNRYTVDEVLGYLERIGNLRVLVIGEPIIDEYVFCDGLGKSTKDPVLAVQYRSMERYAGGSLAVANHLGGIAMDAVLIGQIGEAERNEDFMRMRLGPKVVPYFTTRKNAPTIHKRRFVDHYTGVRLLELYVMDDTKTHPDDEAELIELVSQLAPKADLVVVADYGHGMITPRVARTIEEHAKFLVVNTQANAGNRGFNTVSKFHRADYVCLANHEVETETRQRHVPVSDLVAALPKSINCPRYTITRGKHGTIHFDAGQATVSVPALAGQVVDRVGAGDAVLAITAALTLLEAPWEIIGFIGNIGGGQLVGELGNRVSINRTSLHKAIAALMK